MLEKVNGGDMEALRSFLQTYANHILNRAKLKSPDEAIAREATRITILNIKQAAQKGLVPDEPSPWIDKLTDESVQRLTLPIGNAKKSVAASKAPVSPSAASTARDASAAQQRTKQTEQAQRVVQAQPMAQDKQTAQQPAYSAGAQFVREYQPAAKTAAHTAQRQELQPQRQELQPQRQELQPQRSAQVAKTQRPSQPPRPQERRIPDLFDSDEDLPLEKAQSKRRGKKKRDDAPVGMVFMIFLLVLVVLGLIWMLLVMLMSKGYLPVMDFGFANWFNANVFQLF